MAKKKKLGFIFNFLKKTKNVKKEKKTEKVKAEKKDESKKSNKSKKPKLSTKKTKKVVLSQKDAIKEILEGIKEVEYSTKKKKFLEKEPHTENILKSKISEEEKEPKKEEISQESKEFQAIRTLTTLKKPKINVEKPKLIKTGIPGFDEMCGGGIEERSVVLVNGDAGSGKTIFGLQFLYEAAKNGEAGLFISFGESRETIYSRMLNFGMDFQKLEEKNLFFFLEYQPHEVAKIMQEEGGTLYDIITAYNIKRVVVDTITPYLMQFNDPYKARLALIRLFNVFKKFKVTTLLLNEWSPDLPSHPSTAVAEFLADGIVYIIHKRSPEGVQLRGIEIWKMTGVSHTEVARPFAFTEKGIVIYPNERLFFGPSEKKS